MVDLGTALAAQRLLEARAAALAQEADAQERGPRLDVLVLQLGEERYALELPRLTEILRADEITPVPGTPAFVAGIINRRGGVLAVLDLAVLLGLREPPAPPTAFIAAAESAHGPVGLLVDGVLGDASLPLDALQRSLTGREVVRGIAADGTVLLDLERLLGDARLADLAG